jgi:predicted AAA+ superfamily ATPase
MLKKRWIKEKILHKLRFMRVVMLTGSRQCGKTTLSKSLGDFKYVTLDTESDLYAAESDPNGFIKHDKQTMIIDEIQRVPQLILAIKLAVDEDNRKGQYLITGSVNVLSLSKVQDSLAGRVGLVRLRPFAYGEIIGNEPKFLDRVKEKKFVDNSGFDKRKIIEIAFNGGFPEPLAMDFKERKYWYSDYINTLIKKDLKDIATINKPDVLVDLIPAVSAFSSKFMNKSQIQSKLEISKQTLDEYLNILEMMYVIDRVPAWWKTDYDKVGKSDKTFVTDTGLMSFMLNWQPDKVYGSEDGSGKLFETFVYNQLIAQIELDSDAKLYHYRDAKKREIDFIIETHDEIIGIEVKAGTNIGDNAFSTLHWFKDNLAKEKKFTGIVLYTGKRAMTLKGMHLVPINNLWE